MAEPSGGRPTPRKPGAQSLPQAEPLPFSAKPDAKLSVSVNPSSAKSRNLITPLITLLVGAIITVGAAVVFQRSSAVANRGPTPAATPIPPPAAAPKTEPVAIPDRAQSPAGDEPQPLISSPAETPPVNAVPTSEPKSPATKPATIAESTREPVDTLQFTAQAQPPAAPGEIDQQEFKRMRASLQDVTKDVPDAEKVDAILAFAKNPETLKSPAALKAVLAEALVQAVATKDAVRSRGMLRRLREAPRLFSAEELNASLTLVLNFATSAGDRESARELIDELADRGALSKAEAFAKRSALLRAAAQEKPKKPPAPEQRIELAEEMLTLAQQGADTDFEGAESLIADARKTTGLIANKEQRLAFEKKLAAARAAAADAKRLKQAVERLKQAVERLAADPKDEAAKKVRLEVLVGRGQVKELLPELAAGDHPLSGPAKETVALLQQGAAVDGKACFACAQQWAKLAEQPAYEKNAGVRQMTRDLLELSLAAVEGKLDTFALQKARQLQATFAADKVAESKPADPLPVPTTPDKPKRGERPDVKPAPPENVAGTYVLRYGSGAKRTYRIDNAGNVLFVETKQVATIVKRGDDFILDFKDGKLERVTWAAGVLRVDHFDPAGNYPDGKFQSGSGARE